MEMTGEHTRPLSITGSRMQGASGGQLSPACSRRGGEGETVEKIVEKMS